MSIFFKVLETTLEPLKTPFGKIQISEVEDLAVHVAVQSIT